MKIIYISYSKIPSRAANSIHVMKMCQAFANNGHEVQLIAPQLENNSQIDVYQYYGVERNFKIVFLPHPKIWKGASLLYAYQTLKYVNKNTPDLVYGRFVHGLALIANSGFPCIYESHAPDWEKGSFEYSFLFNWLKKQKSLLKVVVISEALKQIYVNRQALSKNKLKLQVAHDASDEVSDFEGTDLISNKNGLQVGYFGHLYSGRGIDILLKVAKKCHDVDFNFIGGTEEDIKFWKSQNNLENVRFHGYVSPNQVYKYRNSCDILLAPYQNKVAVHGGKGDTSRFMSPLKIFEYMSSKKAIIVSDLPVLREVFNDSNALIIPCADVAAWTEAIMLLKNDVSKREEIAQNAYQDFLENYTWKKRAKFVLENIAL